MEKEKLTWEKDFSRNWNVLKSINNQPNAKQDLNSLYNQDLSNTEQFGLEPVNKAKSPSSQQPGAKLINPKQILQENYLKDANDMKNFIQKNINYNINYLRNVILLIDVTEAMINNDFIPDRKKFLFEKIENFVNEFFNYNFLSTLSILAINNYFTSIVCTSSNDPEYIIKCFRKIMEPEGVPSLVNALSVCYDYSLLLDLSKTSIDLAVFYCSDNTYDRSNLNEILDNYVDNKISINVLTYDTPFEMLKTITSMTNGLLYKADCEEDIDLFLNYITFKKGHKKNPLFKIQLLEPIKKEEAELLCYCHKKFSNLNYVCKDCFTCFCKIPSMCKFCSTILTNEIHMAQLKEPLPIEDYENKFVGVQEMFIKFYEERLSDKKFDFVFEKLVTSISISLGQYTKKESSKKHEQNNYNFALHPEFLRVHQKYIKEEIPIVYYIKAMIIYLKSINILKLKIIYPRIEKNHSNVSSNMMRFYNKNFTEVKKQLNISNEIPLNETFFASKNKFSEKEYEIIPVPEISNQHHSHLEEAIEELMNKNHAYLIKESFHCNGCELYIEKQKNRNLNNFEEYKLCVLCFDTFCINCVSFMDSNNIKCMGCSLKA